MTTIQQWNQIGTLYDKYKIRKDVLGRIALVQGDITKIQIDAIVNTASQTLMSGGSVDGSIRRAAGYQELQRELRKIGYCNVGDAVVTSGAGIGHVKKIIHAVGPYISHEDPTDEEEKQLKSAYIHSLERMKDNNLRTIALPCISTDIYGYPPDEAAWLTGNTLVNWIRKNTEKVDRIIICVAQDEDLKHYNAFFEAVVEKWRKEEADLYMNDLLQEGLKSALTSTAGNGNVCTQEEKKNLGDAVNIIPLSVDKIFELSRQEVRGIPICAANPRTGQFCVKVTKVCGAVINVEALSTDTVFELKGKIQDKEGVSVSDQRLIYAGKMMSDDRHLNDYNICNESTIHLVYRLHGGGCLTYLVHPALFDKKYNRSFIGFTDKKPFYRGGREYIRPLGCRRYALKVLGKYDTNKWLCMTGKYTGSDGEWPVAYHGTLEANTLDIVVDGFDLNKCERFTYGRGIYCTPCPKTALKFASSFSFNGKNYKLIFQVRVDPDELQAVKEKDESRGEYWILPKGDHMRPYGLCIFPVD